MIVVRVELWPNGSERNRRLLGLLRLHNDLTGTEVRGNYQGEGVDRDGATRFEVRHHDRRTGYLPLLRRAVVAWERTTRTEDQ